MKEPRDAMPILILFVIINLVLMTMGLWGKRYAAAIRAMGQA